VPQVDPIYKTGNDDDGADNTDNVDKHYISMPLLVGFELYSTIIGAYRCLPQTCQSIKYREYGARNRGSVIHASPCKDVGDGPSRNSHVASATKDVGNGSSRKSHVMSAKLHTRFVYVLYLDPAELGIPVHCILRNVSTRKSFVYFSHWNGPCN
jgi:hypothetical protein